MDVWLLSEPPIESMLLMQHDIQHMVHHYGLLRNGSIKDCIQIGKPA
jgi:hypothetical protein